MARSILVLAAAAAWALSDGAAAAPVPATAAELERAADEVRKSGGAAGPLSRALAGRRFQFTIVPRRRGPKNEICSGYPSWGWYPQQRLFEVSASEGVHETTFFLDPSGRPAFPAGSGNWVHLVAFSCRYTREPERPAINMYGETVAHQPTRQELVAIAHWAGGESDMGGISVTTDEADALGLGGRIAVRIGGTVGQWAPGRTIVCGADDYSALGVPVLVGDFGGCLVNGRIDRVDYIDSETGEVRRAVRVKAEKRRAR